MSFTASALAALALFGAPQQTPPQDDGSRVGDIEVIGGRTLREAIDVFTETVVAPPRGRGPARWHESVCVGTINLQRDAAQAMIDRVSQVALDIGLDIGEPGCSPSILIVATDDGQAMASAMVDYRPAIFRPNYAGASRSKLQLARFQEREAPVRWWHVALPVVADTGQIAVKMPGGDPPMIPGSGRLRTEIRNDMGRAIIIVDFAQASSVTFEQLADYVSMAAFAQINPDADISAFPTVLNVFDDPASAAGMTDWDMAYLNALYGLELNQRIPNHRSGAVGNVMARDLQNAAQGRSD